MLHANQNERFSKRSFFAALDSGIYDLSTQTREPEGLPPDGGKTQPTPHASPPCAAVPRSPGSRGTPPGQRSISSMMKHSMMSPSLMSL